MMTGNDVVLEVMQAAILVFVAVGAAGVVAAREPLSQAVALTFYGMLLSAMFALFQAPDVALSQIVVGAVVLPLMILLTLSRIHRSKERVAQQDEERS